VLLLPLRSSMCHRLLRPHLQLLRPHLLLLHQLLVVLQHLLLQQHLVVLQHLLLLLHLVPFPSLRAVLAGRANHHNTGTHPSWSSRRCRSWRLAQQEQELHLQQWQEQQPRELPRWKHQQVAPQHHSSCSLGPLMACSSRSSSRRHNSRSSSRHSRWRAGS
jgi:hypothetical protein